MLNVSKTKEPILDLGEYITEDLTWTQHIDIQVRKTKQRLYHLRQLRKFQVSRRILQAFYAGVVESILTGSITSGWCVWLSALSALHSPPCRTCTPGSVDPEPAGS